MTATPEAPARMHSAAFDASMPPIATTGIVTARQTSRSPSRPIGAPRPASTASPRSGPRRRTSRPRTRRRPPRAASDRDAERDPGRSRALGAGVALPEMDAAPELQRRVDVVVDDELRVDVGERATELQRPRRWRRPSGGAGRPSRRPRPPARRSRRPRRARAPSRSSTFARAAGSPGRERRARRRARRGSCPALRARGCVLAGDAEGDERLGRRLERVLLARRGSSP